MMRALALAILGTATIAAATPEECRQLDRRGKIEQATACFAGLTRSTNAFLRAEGLYGLKQYQQAHEAFREASSRDPKNNEIKVRWGRLLIEPFNKNRSDAAGLFSEVLEADKKHAGALLGMAMVASDGFENRATKLAQQALEANPKLLEAQELLAHLALEDVNPARAKEEAEKALAMSGEALDAMAILAAVEMLADRSPDAWLNKIFAINQHYGAAHALVAHHLSLNRRYDDAIAHYRKAIAIDPRDWHAHSKLGISLMQLGQEDEARKELTLAHDNGYREAATTNALNLIATYKNFVTIKSKRGILRLDKKEAELLRVYFEDELDSAITTFEKKYKMKLPVPVQVEVYPNHEDFAVRTMGMPGLGALGVTFGTVVAMDSPSGRKPGTYHWPTTLWHELSHVFVLTATDHRVPRWFTEGLAVHEETAIHPDWGDRLTPDILAAVKDKKLLPVAELDRGFIRPAYPAQVIVSYFQGGRICDYINQKWGYDKLLAMIQGFKQRKSTPQVIEEVLGLKPEAFDKEFFAWVDKTVGPVAAKFDEWAKRIKKLADLAGSRKNEEAIAEGDKLIEMYPEYVEAANAYEFVANAALELKDTGKAFRTLEKYVKIGGRHPEVVKKFAKMQEDRGLKKEAAATLETINYVYPVNDEALHKKLGEIYMDLGQPRRATREFRAWVASNPRDKAGAHYQLALAYVKDGQSAKAEDHVFSALETAPGFRPAQKLLLELNSQNAQKDTPGKK